MYNHLKNYNDLQITTELVSPYNNIKKIIYSKPFEKNGRTIIDHYQEPNVYEQCLKNKWRYTDYVIIKEPDNSYTFQKCYIYSYKDYKEIVVYKKTYEECKKRLNETLGLYYKPDKISNKNFKSSLENEITDWCKGILNV